MTHKRVTQPLEPHLIKSNLLRRWSREARHRPVYYKRDVDVWVPHPVNGIGYPALFIDRPSKSIDFCGLTSTPIKINQEEKSLVCQNHQTLTYPVRVIPQYGQFTAFLHAGTGTKITVETEYGKHATETNMVYNLWRRERSEFKSFLCQYLHENNLALVVDVCLLDYPRNVSNYREHFWEDQLHIIGFIPRQPKEEQLDIMPYEMTKKAINVIEKQIEKDNLYKPYFFKWIDELKSIKTEKTLLRENKKWEAEWEKQKSPRGWTVIDNQYHRYFISSEMNTKLTKLREILEKVKNNPRSFVGCASLSQTEETLFAEWVLNKIDSIDDFIDKSMTEIYQLFSNRKR